jgi:aldehyde dehydrogenase (NAD+)
MRHLDAPAGFSFGGENMRHEQIFVSGSWVTSQKTGDLEVVNPATEETIATVPRGGAEDVDTAATAAANAFESWSTTSVEDRAAVFTKLARLIEERSGEITDLIVREVGTPRSAAVVSQSAGAAEDFNLLVSALSEIVWEERTGTANVRRVPAGVVGAITPWNSPLRAIASKAGAAMAAGCTVVLKASELAPLASYLFADLAAEAELPAGVFNMVSGTGPEVGEAIVAHPAVDMVSLTGSVRAGRRVMELAAQSIKRVHLELGGNSANVILEDADLERAVTVGIEDAFRNAGQVCGGLTRVLVPMNRLAEAEEIAVRKAESFVLGDPFDAATTLGPVKTAAQRDRILNLIHAGIAEGARPLTGGPDRPAGLKRGYYVRPTVFTGVANDMQIAREEMFGPVVSLIPFDGEAEAVAMANDAPYGLAGAVWAADPERARAVAARIRTGRVRVNGAPLEKRAPHGGFKLSGIGREWGRFGIEEFLEYQSVIG